MEDATCWVDASQAVVNKGRWFDEEWALGIRHCSWPLLLTQAPLLPSYLLKPICRPSCIASSAQLQRLPVRCLLQARVLSGHTFPQLLLQELMMVMVTWEVPHRLLAHRLLLLLLPAVGDGLKEWQARALLSTIWHEVGVGDSGQWQRREREGGEGSGTGAGLTG